MWAWLWFCLPSIISSSAPTCPQIFYDHQEGFAALYSSLLSKTLQNSCHDCIQAQAQEFNWKTSKHATEWTCFELLLAATTTCSPLCFTPSLQCSILTPATSSTLQAKFPLSSNSSLVQITPSCETCLEQHSEIETATTISQCQSYCALDCVEACAFPPACMILDPPQNCQSCYENHPGWSEKQCFVSTAQQGCREVCTSTCGDGIVGYLEQCDVGNRTDPGCRDICTITTGYTCYQDQYDSASSCEPICGDGITTSEEACDDGNLSNGDGCSSTCTIEDYWTCSHEDDNVSRCSGICGDLVRVGEEACDEASSGCDASCQIVPGYNCSLGCEPICGDGILVETETCDDGNHQDADGCSSTCQIESGYTCENHPSNCTAICGNGQVEPTEACDAKVGIGCTEECTPKVGYNCSYKGAMARDTCVPICGDGLVVPGETCEALLFVQQGHEHEGCQACQIQPGYSCDAIYHHGQAVGSVCHSICGDGMVTVDEECDVAHSACQDCRVVHGWECNVTSCVPVCGDGIYLEAYEDCDDGNTIPGDGCSATCRIETGYECRYDPHVGDLYSFCGAICGDGYLVGQETCDDGNTRPGDGCSPSCSTEPGFRCSENHQKCWPICGDGRKVNGEECDDGNYRNGDGCSRKCQLEPGYTCSGKTCQSICGDGILTQDEACDDGNLKSGDGCSATCLVESGYACTAHGCTPICGTGKLKPGQACDDGNLDNGDGCSEHCTVESGYSCSRIFNETSHCTDTCGDGMVIEMEECDDGNLQNGDGCSSTCQLESGYICLEPCTTVTASCGDGIVAGNETCDDGNVESGDGCTDTCDLEEGYQCHLTECDTSCGDGIVAGREQCDDGNQRNDDGCSDQCQVENTPEPHLRYFCGTPGESCWKQCNEPRIRRAWEAYSSAEQATYRRAIELSMERGYYATFVGIHFESRNEVQAHTTCAFLAWHRKYLLAFENMLRSLGDEYLCVTLPYWDYFADYANFISGRCTSIEGCSSLCQELGGSVGPFRAVNVPGSGAMSGSCVASSPNNYICPISISSNGNGTCSRCIPRGNWQGTRFPAGLGYASIARLFSGGQGYASLNDGIQRGFHNTIHSALDGMMATLASPADVIFFSHHNTIDMSYQIHHKCYFGRRLSPIEKQRNPHAYEGCGATPLDGMPTATSTIRMDVYSAQHRRMMDPHEHPVTAPFFKDLPREYWAYVDTTDLGPFSYNYEVDNLLSALMSNGLICQNPSYVFAAGHGIRKRQQRRVVAADTYQPAYDQYFLWFNETCQQAKQSFGYEQGLSFWQYQQVLDQVEMVECLNYERRYGCPDYSNTFKYHFHVNYKARCKYIVDEITNGSMKIMVDNWQHTCDRYLNAGYERHVTANDPHSYYAYKHQPEFTTTTSSYFDQYGHPLVNNYYEQPLFDQYGRPIHPKNTPTQYYDQQGKPYTVPSLFDHDGIPEVYHGPGTYYDDSGKAVAIPILYDEYGEPIGMQYYDERGKLVPVPILYDQYGAVTNYHGNAAYFDRHGNIYQLPQLYNSQGEPIGVQYYDARGHPYNLPVLYDEFGHETTYHGNIAYFDARGNRYNFPQLYDQYGQPIGTELQTQYYDQYGQPLNLPHLYDEYGRPIDFHQIRKSEYYDERGKIYEIPTLYDRYGQRIDAPEITVPTLYDRAGHEVHYYSNGKEFYNQENQIVQLYDQYGHPVSQAPIYYDIHGQRVTTFYDQYGHRIPFQSNAIVYDEYGHKLELYDEYGRKIHTKSTHLGDKLVNQLQDLYK